MTQLTATATAGAGAALYAIAAAAGLLLLLRIRPILYLLSRCCRYLDELTHPHQTFTIPRHDAASGADNPLHRKAALYLSSLPSLESSTGAAVLSSGRKPNDFLLHPLPHHPIRDSFLSSPLTWTPHPDRLLLSLRRLDRRRVLRPYLQHVESVADDLLLRRRSLRLFSPSPTAATWLPAPFTHPATLDTIAMDDDLKKRLRNDWDQYLSGKSYYHRLGRVWRRSYLLHGPPGTGKSTFVAAMAKTLNYDIYDLDLSRVAPADLRSLLLQTTPRSIILIEDFDKYSTMEGMLTVMDGVFSCCGEERVMVFTGEGRDGMEAAALRPGRVDVQVRFPMCDFPAFKTLASSYLGLKDHKLYPQVEEGFQSGAAISHAEVGEIMIANRSSPSRAIKSVISALQRSSSSTGGAGIQRSGPLNGGHVEMVVSENCGGGGGGLGFGKDATMREFRKLYGLIRMRSSGSRRDGMMPLELAAAQAAAANANAASTILDKDR